MRYLIQPLTCWLALHTLLHALAAKKVSSALPLFRVVDLNRGETAQVTLSDGEKVNIKLLEVDETRDAVRSAVRLARVSVEINGRNVTLDSGNYRLPIIAGIERNISSIDLHRHSRQTNRRTHGVTRFIHLEQLDVHLFSVGKGDLRSFASVQINDAKEREG